jgi:hypothetical protein
MSRPVVTVPKRATGRAARARATAVVALAASAALLAGACTGDEGAAGGDAPGNQSTAPGLTVAGEWPLTGFPAAGATPTHPVMVVKIDNSENSRPQVGLKGADLVTEELVEGGSTRLAVFFYQKVPRMVGPVRSMRATDIGIVKPAQAVLVASGGAPPTVARIKKAGITTFTEGATGYRRDGSRTAPYNLFMDLAKLSTTTRAKGTIAGYLPFGSEKDLPEGRPASGLSAVFSGGHTTRWAYDRGTGASGGTYTDQDSFAADGDRFRPDTVLVLRVKVGDAGYLDPAGNPVPETKFTGSGKALLFHGGRVVRGTWSKSLTSTVSLRTASGALTVPSGHTWIELVPAKAGKVVITK